MADLGDFPIVLGGEDDASLVPSRLGAIFVPTETGDEAHPALLDSVSIWLSFDNGATYEPAVLAGTYDERYADASSRVATARGFDWYLMRRAGVPAAVPLVATYWTALGTVSPGDQGPAVTVTPATDAIVSRRSTLQLDFVAGDYAVDEASIAAWVSFDGGGRWDAVIRGGLMEAYLYGAGIKATITGGFRFTFNRSAGWYRKGMLLKVSAYDAQGLADGQTVAA